MGGRRESEFQGLQVAHAGGDLLQRLHALVLDEVVFHAGLGGVDADAGARGRGPRGGREAMQATMDRPEMQRLAALQQKAALDTRFAPLFKSLNLSPEKLATLKALLAEKEATMMDTMRAAREQGLDPRSDPEGFKKLVAATQAETNSAIKAAIGESAYAQYENYQATQPQRAVVSQLQQTLSYTNAPLTSAQADQMVQVLAATTTAPASASRRSICASTSAVWLRMSLASHSGTMPAR